MTSSKDSNPLFQELRVFFDEAARLPVNKGSSDTGAHYQVVLSVCKAVFASQDVQQLWTHTSQIIDALLLEVQHRPAILLYVPSSMAANNGKSQLGTQDRPQPAIQSAGDLLLAPWLTANLLRVIGSLSSITSESLAPAIQQATLDKLRETVALIVTAVDAQYAAEEVDALAVLSHMVDGLFVLLQVMEHPPIEHTLCLALDEQSAADTSVQLSRSQIKALQPSLFDILAQLVANNVGIDHGPRLCHSLQFFYESICGGGSGEGKGKAKQRSEEQQVQDFCAVLSPLCILFSPQTALACPSVAVASMSLLLQALRARVHVMEWQPDNYARLDAQLSKVALQAFAAMSAGEQVQWATQLLLLSDIEETILPLCALLRESPEEHTAGLKVTTAALLAQLDQNHISTIIPDASSVVHSLLLTEDLPMSVRQKLSSIGPNGAHKRKRDEADDDDVVVVSTNKTHWKLTAEALLNVAAPDLPWSTNESIDAALVRLVQHLSSLPASSASKTRQVILRVLGLIACARDDTLDWASSNPLSDAHCPACDDSYDTIDQQREQSPPPGRSMRGVAIAALLQAQTAQAAFTNQDHLAAFRALSRLLQHSKPSAQAIDPKTDPAKIISRFLDHDSRSVRIGAGKALATAVQVSVQEGDGEGYVAASAGPDISFAIRKLESCLAGKKALRETALITLGGIGRWAADESLGTILQLVVGQLGRQGDPIASLASLQTVNIAKSRGISTYKLVAPFLPTLSPYIIQRNSASLLDAFAELVGVARIIFLKQNASYILPVLIVQQRKQHIQHLAAACDLTIPELVAHNAAHIISFLQLANFDDCCKGTNFMLSLFASSQTLRSIFQSCTAEVLFELVVEWGDRTARSDLAISALEKLVQQNVAETKSVDELLASQLLGILALMNDFLNDLHGRRSSLQKQKALTGLGRLISKVGVAISDVTPQVMATLQSSLAVPLLRHPTLEAWYAFITSLKFTDIGPFVGQTSAALVRMYPDLRKPEQDIARKILEYLVKHHGSLGDYAADMADVTSIPALASMSQSLARTRLQESFESRMEQMLRRVDSDNESVCHRGLFDLKSVIESHPRQMREMGAGDTFDAILGRTMKSVISAAIRSGDTWLEVRDLAFECLGSLGALDPDRLEMPTEKASFVLQNNFTDTQESMDFAVDFIQHVLVRAYQSSNDTKHQAALAYSIQQLLRFCQFTPTLLVADSAKSSSVPVHVKTRWQLLPKPIVETIAPLLTSRFEVKLSAPSLAIERPLYSHRVTYREWIRDWGLDLIGSVTDPSAKAVFSAFLSVIKSGDVGVARRLIPHLVLHLVISQKGIADIQREVLDVLQDQIRPDPLLPPDSRLLCAQTVFDVMDHLGQWMRRKSAELAKRRHKHRRNPQAAAEALERSKAVVRPVSQLLSSVPQELQALAAQRCKSHARALLNFERRLADARRRSTVHPKQINEQFELLHEIYAELEEPDGMEGISTQIIEPSTMHRIREHESTGRWTSAQSCWEVELQGEPDNLANHIGLLRCLRNLGHYDSMRTHIVGVLHSHPEWRPSLAPYELQGSLIVGDWSKLSEVAPFADAREPAMVFSCVVQALRQPSHPHLDSIFRHARDQLGGEIVAAGSESYRRVYDALTNLHVLHELDLIHRQGRVATDDGFLIRLDARLGSLSPAFRVQEQVLSMRRTAFRLSKESDPRIGQLWLQTAKVARKAGHPQTAYSATLQAERAQDVRSFLQRVKLEKSVGQATKALQELERELKPLIHDGRTNEKDTFLAKGALTRARWMVEADRYDTNEIVKVFNQADDLSTGWESPWYYLGQYYQGLCQRQQGDGTVEELDAQTRQFQHHTVKCFIQSLIMGSKFIYQAMPRWLTIFMDFGMHKELLRLLRNRRKSDQRSAIPSNDVQNVERDFRKLYGLALKAIERLPVWQWMTVFPQVVSRICHAHDEVYKMLESVMVRVLQHYPDQAVWQMAAVVHSTVSKRSKRCLNIFSKTKNTSTSDIIKVVSAGESMVKQMLDLANYRVSDQEELRMSNQFKGLRSQTPSPLIVPLQNSLTVVMPSSVIDQYIHKPFPADLPRINRFDDQIDVMNSLAKPRKIVVRDQHGQAYSFLCKPHDDLRKDARLMEFNAMINKLLKKDSESRRRHLTIRTYCVLPLNEECGLIEWVPNTIGFRHIVARLWEARGIPPFTLEVKAAFDNIRKPPKDKDGLDTTGRRFQDQVLSRYPAVFHEWFLEAFPEPSTWLRNRMAYARTAAVMSMVGFVLGLGDRHGENILFDSTTGDTVHVDFNCLFDKGRTFEVAERVPFRLTQNIVDGFGITGVEGPFRRSCEISMRILRESQDSLMSVLEAFVHDPLVEWGKKRKGSSGVDDAATDEARKALVPIRRKLQGFQASSDPKNHSTYAVTIENHVQNLIQEATSLDNLGSMYIGWASYM